MRGELIQAVAQFSAVVADCQAAHDEFPTASGLMGLGVAHAQRVR